MALVVATIQTAIKDELDAEFGPADDAAQQAKFTKAIAEAVFKVLTAQAAVSNTGATLVGPPGGPLPITPASLPGVIV
jgi:hypothetical protein